MPFYKASLTGIVIAAMAIITACSSDRLTNLPHMEHPVVIQSAPLGSISQSVLSSPADMQHSDMQEMGIQQQENMPSTTKTALEDAALIPSHVAGVWKVFLGGMNCQIATPQTKFGQGYRACPIRCPAVLSGVNSWNINGAQLIFYDKNDQSIVTLYPSDVSRFEGWTVSGVGIILSR
ncbi:MAG: hypothetical protein JSC085_000658 [Candidatus Tokpelaia sp. JSC085]|nr:MAG: hypothetical protein JSC085_000658 [Candidatus Tokpelaia sp. JSC085]